MILCITSAPYNPLILSQQIYKQYNQMKKTASLTLTKAMSNDEKRQFKELHQIFAQFDTDGNGTISLQQWQQAMQRFGHQASQQEISEMLTTNNIPRKNYITFHQFVTLITNKKKQIKGQEHAQLVKAFRLFDKDLDCILNAHQLKAGLQRYGQDMRLEDLQLLVTMADHDNDGSINFQEFSRIMEFK